MTFKDNINIYISSTVNRIIAKADESSNLGDSRGYNRIVEIGNDVFFGYGEGAFYRFTTMKGNETHSSYATIIVSYGIFGSILYLIFFYKINNEKISNIYSFFLIFSGILFYWISHNGLRNSLFWILIMLYNFKLTEEETVPKKLL